MKLVEGFPDAVLVVDSEGHILLVNVAAEQMFGKSRIELLGETFGFPVSSSRAQEIEIVQASGRPIIAEMRANRMRHRNRILYVVSLRDITEHALHRTALLEASLTDPLTGLFNRAGFAFFANQDLEEARRIGDSVAVFMVDLDKLKAINDTYGHSAGDRAIVAAAKILREALGPSDVVARIGGDEYAAYARGADRAAIDRILTAIRTSVEALNAEKTWPYAVSLSVGFVYVTPNDTRSLDELLHEADQFLYFSRRAKIA